MYVNIWCTEDDVAGASIDDGDVQTKQQSSSKDTASAAAVDDVYVKDREKLATGELFLC